MDNEPIGWGFRDNFHSAAMDLLGVMAGGNFWKILRNDPIVMWCQICERELALAKHIDAGKPWNPRCVDSR